MKYAQALHDAVVSIANCCKAENTFLSNRHAGILLECASQLDYYCKLIEELQLELAGTRRAMEKGHASTVAERNEARRMYCSAMADIVSPYRSPEQIAADRGWDCYEPAAITFADVWRRASEANDRRNDMEYAEERRKDEKAS